MTHQNAMSGWLCLSVALLVAILPGLLASPLEAVNLRSHLVTRAVKDPLCKDQLTSCASCSKIRNCVKIGKNYYNTGTPTECGGRTPWCVEQDGAASCVATAPTDDTCSKPQPTDFVCTQTGYFPDISSCSNYFVCVEDPTTKELVSYAYNCTASPGTHYDAATALCKLGECSKLYCPHPNGMTYQLWPPAPWMYASCVDSDNRNALIGACPKGQAWDGEDCVQACHEEGRFAALSDTTGTRYIECVALDSTGRLSLPVPGKCPVGSRFSSAESLCVEALATTPVPTTTAALATTVPAAAATTVPETADTTVPAATATTVPAAAATAAPAGTEPTTPQP